VPPETLPCNETLDKHLFSWHFFAMPKLRILAIIPARGGSKGIPHKNIRRFAGKPLIAHTIGAARSSRFVDRIVVSTDDKKIAAVARAYGAEVPFMRPKPLANDKSSIIDALIYTLEKLENDEGYIPTHLLLLQPTNPMRTADDIKNAVALMKKRRADSVISVCRTENLLITKDETDRLTILNPKLLKQPNRQQLPNYYKLDGCMIYLTDARKFRKERSLFAGKLVGYEIERWRAVDLDEPQDFVVGELVYKQQARVRRTLKTF
jgi:CMP-N-acetylneuraminic acid synthetase